MKTETSRRTGGGALTIALVVLVALAAVVGGGWAAVSAMKGGDKAAGPSMDVFTVSRANFLITTTSNGSLAARKQTELRSEVKNQTTIVQIVDEGTMVKKGDLLIQLSTDAIEDRLREAEDRLRTAENQAIVARSALEIQKSDNDSALRQAEVKLQLAILDLEKWQQGDLVQRRNELTTALERAIREEERLRQKLDRSNELFEQEFYSQDELEQDRIAHLDAQATLFKAKLAQVTFEEYEYKKELTRLESDVREATAELERVKTRNESQLTTKQSELEYAEVNLRQRQAELKEEQEQMAAATITAPSDGLVVYSSSIDQGRGWNNEGPLAVGSEVRQNESLIILPDTSEMMAEVKVHESLVSKVKQGQRAIVKIDAANGRSLEGRVDSVGVLAQSDSWRDPDRREYDVRIALDMGAANFELKPGMRCEAEIQMDSVEDVIAVPLASLFIENGINFVYMQDGARYRRAPVRVGRRSETQAEILAGVDERARLLLREPRGNEVIPGEFTKEALAAVGGGERDGRGRRGGEEPAAADEAPVSEPETVESTAMRGG